VENIRRALARAGGGLVDDARSRARGWRTRGGLVDSTVRTFDDESYRNARAVDEAVSEDVA